MKDFIAVHEDYDVIFININDISCIESGCYEGSHIKMRTGKSINVKEVPGMVIAKIKEAQDA